jgi:hypothetical protein
MNETQLNNEITNDLAPNKEEVKMSVEDIMWMARRQKNRKLYAMARTQLGLGKHWLQQTNLPKSRQWGGGK